MTRYDPIDLEKLWKDLYPRWYHQDYYPNTSYYWTNLVRSDYYNKETDTYDFPFPGYDKNEVQITIEDDCIQVKSDDGKYTYCILLPDNLQEVECDMKNGLAKIKLITKQKDVKITYK